jgi:hypothetical protein
MLAMPGCKTISTNTQHRRLLLALVRFNFGSGRPAKGKTSAASLGFGKRFNFGSGRPAREKMILCLEQFRRQTTFF